MVLQFQNYPSFPLSPSFLPLLGRVCGQLKSSMSKSRMLLPSGMQSIRQTTQSALAQDLPPLS